MLMLAIVGISGCKKEDDEVSHEPKPVAGFTYNILNDFAPSDVEFFNKSKNASSYSWDFGVGNATSHQENPSFTYNSGGIYTVTLNVEGPGGTESISKTLNISDSPSNINIKKLKLVSYPQTEPSGTGWDFTSGPDIYWKLMNEDYSTTYFISEVYNDVVFNDLPLIYTEDLPYGIEGLDKIYTILFFDDDFDEDDYMDGYYFDLSGVNTYPSVLTFSDSNSDLEFDLYVQWANGDKQFPINEDNKVRIELKPIEQLNR